MDNSDAKLASLEALLFIHGEPLSYKKIEAVLGLEKGEGESLVGEFGRKLDEAGRGLQLISDREKVQLTTKPQFNKILEDFVKEELTEDLTPASIEALSLVTYLGPLSRARLEYLRGVNSIVILRSLMIRGLIERFPDPEHPSGFLYRPTFELMKHLGLSKKEDLSEYEKFQGLLKVFEAQNNSTAPDAPGTAPQAAEPPAAPLATEPSAPVEPQPHEEHEQ